MPKNQTSFKKGHKVPRSWRVAVSAARKNHTPWNKGKKWSADSISKMRIAKKGKKIKHLKKVQFKKGHIPWNKGKGTKCSEYVLIRSSKPYRVWRESVFQRDNYTCQKCQQKGGVLNADHIKKFSEYPELRFDLNNGQTLCVPCHRKTPNFGNKKSSTPEHMQHTSTYY